MSEKNTESIEPVEIDQAMGVMPEEVDPGMSVMPGPGVADTPTVIPELDPMFAVALDQLPAYTTTDWKNKPSTATPVTAEIMKKIEQRLVDLTNAYNNQEAEIKTLRDSVSQIALNNCTLAVSANNDWFGIYVRGRGMSSFGMEVNATGKNVQFVKDGEPFKSL